MKLLKRAISGLIAAAVCGCIAASAFTAQAVVTISDGVFEYAYENNCWTLHSYIGSDPAPVLPQSFGGDPVKYIADECFQNSAVTSITVPDGYETIGNYAFYGCENLTSISLPDSIDTIGMGAFAQSGLESLDLSETGVSFIAGYLCMNCRALSSVTLPQGITGIGISAFDGTGLESVVIPEGVTVLGDSSFANTGSLLSASLPNGLEVIGEGCFQSSALTQINLPVGLESIGASAFRGDNGLESLFIPDSVYSIGANALLPMSYMGTVEVSVFKNSYADVYCYENFVTNTVSYDKIYGDANLDGLVDITDATAVQRDSAGLEALKPAGRVLADVNFDGRVLVDDATLIQRYLVGLIDEFTNQG